jgi:hypothetical protein
MSIENSVNLMIAGGCSYATCKDIINNIWAEGAKENGLMWLEAKKKSGAFQTNKLLFRPIVGGLLINK